jgi:hypothetical protein
MSNSYDPVRETPKLDEIRNLVKENNISYPLLAELSNHTRIQIRNILLTRKTELPEDQYTNLKEAINTILKKNLMAKGLGEVIKGDMKNSNKNKKKIKDFLHENGISNSRAAKILNCSIVYIHVMTEKNHPRELSDGKAQEILDKLIAFKEN